MFTDKLEKFNEETKNNWAGNKGLRRNETCWTVLETVQHDMEYQNWLLMMMNKNKILVKYLTRDDSVLLFTQFYAAFYGFYFCSKIQVMLSTF